MPRTMGSCKGCVKVITTYIRIAHVFHLYNLLCLLAHSAYSLLSCWHSLIVASFLSSSFESVIWTKNVPLHDTVSKLSNVGRERERERNHPKIHSTHKGPHITIICTNIDKRSLFVLISASLALPLCIHALYADVSNWKPVFNHHYASSARIISITSNFCFFPLVFDARRVNLDNLIWIEHPTHLRMNEDLNCKCEKNNWAACKSTDDYINPSMWFDIRYQNAFVFLCIECSILLSV